MSEIPSAAPLPVVLSLTDEELLALGAMTGQRWPRPLRALAHGAEASLQAASGVRSLQARGLLEPELPSEAAGIMGTVMAVYADPPASMTVAVTDADFVIDPGFPVLEILFVPDGVLAVSSTIPGVHTLRVSPVGQVLDSFSEWVDAWSGAGAGGERQVTAFVRDAGGSGVAGAVLAPRAARLRRVDADTWRPVALDEPASPRELLEGLVDLVAPAVVA